jgi:cell division protein FtsI (penicillin-binding protein 3)
MNERIKLILFLFLVSLSFYVIRAVMISYTFKPVPISPGVSYFPAPFGKIVGSDGDSLLFSQLSYDVYLDIKYAKVISTLKGWKYPEVVYDALDFFGVKQTDTILNKIKKGLGGVEIGIVPKNKVLEIPEKYKDFLNITSVYTLSSPPTPTKVLVKAIAKEYADSIQPKKKGKVVYEKFGPYKLYSNVKKIVDPIGGDTLLTNIDPRIQSFVYNKAEEVAKSNAASGVQIIVSNPQTGAVIAMASTWPWNAPVMNVFEPGSTIKPLVFAAALQKGVVSTSTTFSTPFFIPSPKVPLVIKDSENHPWPIDLRQALVYSSDVAEMNIAHDYILKYGRDAFYHLFLSLGFGSKTGIDLPDEIKGLLLPPQKWYAIGGVEMSIGQGIAVTGIQLVTALNSIANGGYIVKPHVVDEILSPSGTVVYRYVKSEKKIFAEEVTRVIKNFMIDVVRYGTGKRAKIEGVVVGGKTGTAQKPMNGKISKEGPFFSLFYGFFPASDPIYSILVVVDQPSNGKYYGGDVAAPVFRDVGKYILSLKGYPNHLETNKRSFLPTVFPNLKGLTLNESLQLLKELSIPASMITFSGNGVVRDQIPQPYTPLLKVKNVKIYLGPSF